MMSFFSSKRVELTDHNCVLPHALKIPALEKLVGKRVVLASVRQRALSPYHNRPSDYRIGTFRY